MPADGPRTTWTDPRDAVVHALVLPLERFPPGSRAEIAEAVRADRVCARTDGTWLTVCGLTLPRMVDLDPHEPVTCPACQEHEGGDAVRMAEVLMAQVREGVVFAS
jgi:hypothetical protein